MAGSIGRVEIDANGHTFSGLTAGPARGRRVLLLHGFPQTSFAWRGQLGALADAGYRGVAVDQRGYCPGARPARVSDYDVAHLVADVIGMADALDMERLDLVGHDWGGMVAWLVANRYPERLRSLTVVSTPHPSALQHAILGGDRQQAAQAATMDAFRQPEVPERLLLGPDGSGSGLSSVLADSGLDAASIREYVSVLRQPGALSAALNWYRAMGRPDPLDSAPIVVPTLYVWSTGDAALGRTAAEATAPCVRAPFQFAILDGVSHWIPETAPEEMSTLLIDHLSRT